MQPGQLTQDDQRDIPDHMALCSAIKTGGKKMEAGDIGNDGVCLLKKQLHVMSPAFLEMAEKLPANEK